MRNFGVSFWNYNPFERATSGRGTMDLVGITMLLIGVDGMGFSKASMPARRRSATRSIVR
jgi:hypothetical protein